MKKALVLAGGFPQIALIKELKKRNYIIVLADWNDEPVAKEYCDIYYKESTLDVDAIKNIAIKENVDFIITVCTDQALLTVAKVSEDLGLPCYIDYQTALNVTNKEYMKSVFVENDIPTAKHIILNELDLQLLETFKYPIITKPVDCNSSKGVLKSHNYSELIYNFQISKNFSRTKTAIIEEFIEGQEITVDVYVENSKAVVLSTSNSEKIKNNDKFVIFRTLNPAFPNVEEKIKIVAQKIVDSFGIKNSPMLIQLLTDGDNIYVIEFSARTGGGVKYLLIEKVSGFDVVKAVVDLTIGLIPKCNTKPKKFKYLTNEFIYCKPGVFSHLEGFEMLKKEGYIEDYYLFKNKGVTFTDITNSGDRIAGFTIVGDTEIEMKQKHDYVNNNFKVIDMDGNDIARHDLLTDLKFNKEIENHE